MARFDIDKTSKCDSTKRDTTWGLCISVQQKYKHHTDIWNAEEQTKENKNPHTNLWEKKQNQGVKCEI